MRVIARGTLRDYWRSNKNAEQPLKAWFQEARKANWINHHDVKAQYRTASILKDNRVIFNIGGGKYRLMVRINYKMKAIFIKFIGTHDEYDKANMEKI